MVVNAGREIVESSGAIAGSVCNRGAGGVTSSGATPASRVGSDVLAAVRSSIVASTARKPGLIRSAAAGFAPSSGVIARCIVRAA